jgi:hypothetical protein
MKKSVTDGSELDGYELLRPEDQAKVVKAWQEGHVADEDSTRKPVGKHGGEVKKRKKAKRAPAKKKVAAAEAEERPKKKAKTAPAKVRLKHPFVKY